MEKIKTDCKQRNWKIQAKFSKCASHDYCHDVTLLTFLSRDLIFLDISSIFRLHENKNLVSIIKRFKEQPAKTQSGTPLKRKVYKTEKTAAARSSSNLDQNPAHLFQWQTQQIPRLWTEWIHHASQAYPCQALCLSPDRASVIREKWTVRLANHPFQAVGMKARSTGVFRP